MVAPSGSVATAADIDGANREMQTVSRSVKEFIDGILERFKKQEKSIEYEPIPAPKTHTQERGKRSKNKDYERQEIIMKQHFTDERTGISYTLQGDYYLPDLALPAEEQVEVGIWEQRHLKYIKAHRKGFLYDLAHKMRTEQTPCRCKQAG